MTTQRINGLRLNLDTMSAADLLGVVEHSYDRFQRSEVELRTVIECAIGRGVLHDEVAYTLMPNLEQKG